MKFVFLCDSNYLKGDYSAFTSNFPVEHELLVMSAEDFLKAKRFPEGTFAINHRYDLSDESLTGRPLIMFKENTGNEYESMKTYYAKSGWIEFTECDPATMTMGGKFEFTAVYSKGDTSETIKVTEGRFSNIPYENATLEE